MSTRAPVIHNNYPTNMRQLFLTTWNHDLMNISSQTEQHSFVSQLSVT